MFLSILILFYDIFEVSVYFYQRIHVIISCMCLTKITSSETVSIRS